MRTYGPRRADAGSVATLTSKPPLIQGSIADQDGKHRLLLLSFSHTVMDTFTTSRQSRSVCILFCFQPLFSCQPWEHVF